jgi:LysM repeat protein
MYSISKRFMVPIADIMTLNGLKSTDVKEGQILIIPVKNERVDKVRIKSVSGAYDPESEEPLVFPVKEKYNIAILLPFYLDYGPGYSEYMSNLSAQFYMGALLAIDSLEMRGLKAKIHVFDTKNDTNEVKKILSKPVFGDMDLIIGPLLPNSMEQVARFCKLNKIRMVCPVESDAALLKDNRLVYAGVSSNITLMEGLARHMLINNSKDHIVLIKPLDSSSMPMYDAFRNEFNNAPFSGSRPLLTESTVTDFSTYIRKGVNTLFVVPTNDRSTAIKFMNNLNRSAFKSKSDDLFVYGTKNWANFEDINNVYKNKYNFRFPSSNFMDYYSDAMIELNRMYRVRFKTDLSKMAAQAYDITLFFCSDFFLGNSAPNLVMNDFQMQQVSDADGYENTNIFIVEQGDYELFNSELRD